MFTPLRASFCDEEDTVWMIIECGIDIVFSLDMVLTFFSAYYNNIEQLINDPRQIACSYLRSWFALDLISVLPLDLLFRSSASQFGKLAKIPRIYQIVKTTKYAFINL